MLLPTSEKKSLHSLTFVKRPEVESRSRGPTETPGIKVLLKRLFSKRLTFCCYNPKNTTLSRCSNDAALLRSHRLTVGKAPRQSPLLPPLCKNSLRKNSSTRNLVRRTQSFAFFRLKKQEEISQRGNINPPLTLEKNITGYQTSLVHG